MAVPDRSTLPQEFLDFLDYQLAHVNGNYGRKPILPAAETPEELVEAARVFERVLDDEWFAL